MPVSTHPSIPQADLRMTSDPAGPPGAERSSGVTEVELKLLCDPELLPAIRASPVLTRRQRVAWREFRDLELPL